MKEVSFKDPYDKIPLVIQIEDDAEGLNEDIESDVARAEIEQTIDTWLRENLTVVQYERFMLLMDGMSIREIARKQAVDFSSVNESIKATQKKTSKDLA